MSGVLLAALLVGLAAEPDELGTVRASAAAGASLRTARLEVPGVLATNVGGLSPTSVRAEGRWYFWRFLGVAVDFGADWYVATGRGFEPGSVVHVPMASVRAAAAVAGRLVPLPWLGLEARLGWAFGRTALLDASSGTALGVAATATGPHAALVITVDPGGWVSGELSARGMPVIVTGAGPDGRPVRGSSWGVGAQLGFGALELGGLRWAVVVDYELGAATGNGAAFAFRETSHQLGLGLRVVGGLPPRVVPPAGPGTLRGRIESAGQPLPAATVAVAGLVAHSDAQGRFQLGPLGPGAVSGTVEAAGFRPGTLEVVVPPGGAVEVSVSLERKPSGPGAVTGLVLLAPGQPVAGLEVLIEGHEPVKTGADGRFKLPNVAAGLVSLIVRGKGYVTLEEPVRVTPEVTAEVSLTVRKVGETKPGVIRGIIQSLAGKPVAATVKVVEAKLTTKVGRDGRFEVTVPAGAYTLQVSAPGFVTQTLNVELAGGDHAIFHCELQPVAR